MASIIIFYQHWQTTDTRIGQKKQRNKTLFSSSSNDQSIELPLYDITVIFLFFIRCYPCWSIYHLFLTIWTYFWILYTLHI